jgi:hypothetical protein
MDINGPWHPKTHTNYTQTLILRYVWNTFPEYTLSLKPTLFIYDFRMTIYVFVFNSSIEKTTLWIAMEGRHHISLTTLMKLLQRIFHL